MDRNTKLAISGAAIARREQKRQEKGASGGKTKKGTLMRAIFGIFPLLVIRLRAVTFNVNQLLFFLVRNLWLT